MKTVFASDIKLSVDELVEAHLNGTSVSINDIEYQVVSECKNFNRCEPFIGFEFELKAFGSINTDGCNRPINKKISISIQEVEKGVNQVTVTEDLTESRILVNSKTGEAIKNGPPRETTGEI